MNPPVEPTAPNYVTCYCLHCKGGIEFDANQLRPNEKRAVTCPHCKAETVLIIPEKKVVAPTPAVPAKETPAPKPEPPKVEPPKAEVAKPEPPKIETAKPEIIKPPIEIAPPAKPDEWRVELPLGGRDGYIGYYEGARAASFYWEFGGGVVLAVIHIGSPTDWNKLYSWATDRRLEILQRVIQEVIRQRALKCKTDIDEKSGHIFFRSIEAVKSVIESAPPVKMPEPPKELLKELPKELPKELLKETPKPNPADEAKWQQEMGVASFREKDFAGAVKCFMKAAELGNAEAQCYLGFCFMYGQGVEKNEAKSLEWFLKAAAQGNVGAEYCLGGAYYLGRGVPKDFSAAVKWWRKAGEHGNADAQNNLAGCFEKGEGVMRNFVEAYKWAKRASAQNNQAAQKKCEELLLKMNPEQIKMVKTLG